MKLESFPNEIFYASLDLSCRLRYVWAKGLRFKQILIQV